MAIRLSKTFVLRKLHQLTGILPLGIFLLEHFYTNSKALSGAADFNNAVKDLQSIPYILFVEIGGIFIPLVYHAVYGLVITNTLMRDNNYGIFGSNSQEGVKSLAMYAPDAYVALREDAGLQSILESSIYSRDVTDAAIVDPTATVGEGTVMYPGVYVGPRARIGRER